MSGRRTLDAGMTCEFHSLGLLPYQPSLKTGVFGAPRGWSEQRFMTLSPNSGDAEPRYRQSHERGCCP